MHLNRINICPTCGTENEGTVTIGYCDEDTCGKDKIVCLYCYKHHIAKEHNKMVQFTQDEAVNAISNQTKCRDLEMLEYQIKDLKTNAVSTVIQELLDKMIVMTRTQKESISKNYEVAK